jgi:uncharacterized repeat protein (TIGR01451 family)
VRVLRARRQTMLCIKEWGEILSRALLATLLGLGITLEIGAKPSSQIYESDWPMLQHDVAHSGYTSDTLVSPDYGGTLNVKWKVGLGERIEIEMQPIVAYGRVYIGVMNGKLHAINEETGDIEWTYQAGGAISHTPAAGEDKVFFGSEDHRVYAIDANTGLEAWIYETGGPILSSPIIHGRTVYIGSFDHYLYAIDTENGQLRWRYDAGNRVWTSPSLDVENSRLYFGSEQPKAHCLNATTGELLWTHDLAGEGMRNTYPTFADDVVIFQTIKPGVSAYEAAEGFPEHIDDATTLEQYAAYYSQYPQRRHLYYLNATTGEDMWDGDGINYVPVVIPYWGMLEPVIDPQGYAWIPINSGGSSRNIDLYKVDLSSGRYIKVAETEEFFERGDETGRFTFANGVYYSSVLSAIAKYNPQSNQEKRIFGPFPGGDSFECLDLDPMPVECPHVDRIAGTTGFGGLHRASALVIANGTGFFTTHGWLYALTPDSVSTTHSVDLGADLTPGAPARQITYNDLVAELNARVDQIISYGHLEPFPYSWDWRSLPPSLWQEGEMVRTLAYAMPYLTKGNQDALKQYLRNEVVHYLLDPDQYEYQLQCQLYGSYDVLDCEFEEYEDQVKSRWYANDENYTAERVYAFYAYAKYTGDWQLIEDNWDFIVSRYDVVVEQFDSDLGHVVTRQWLSGENLDLQTQAASFYAMKEMAARVGDHSLANQAEDYYNQVIQARAYYGSDFISELYDSEALTPITAEEVGDQKIVYPPEGIINRDTDIRQLGWRDSERIELRVSGVSHAGRELAPNIYEAIVEGYDYPVQHLQMYPEIGQALSSDLRESTQKYLDAIAYYNPWWYWGDNGHVLHKGGENLYSKPFMAAALFQAKAYILKEDFHTLKDYLPWPVNRAGFRDIYRLQNLVALLQTKPPSTKSVSSATADHGDVLTYTISVLGTGATVTITDTIPAGTTYVPNSATTQPQLGTLATDSDLIHWNGVLAEHIPFELTFAVTVTVMEPSTIVNTAKVDNGSGPVELSTTTLANGSKTYLPVVCLGATAVLVVGASGLFERQRVLTGG